MTGEFWSSPTGRPVMEYRCCGLVWQIVYGGLQKKYWRVPFNCPRCGAQSKPWTDS